mgnify:CR=1 FL=1
MADLVFIAFPTEQRAEEVRRHVLDLQRGYLIQLEDAVVVMKDPAGHVRLHQLVNLTAGGAASGALWGTLIGMIFMRSLAGAAIGAASGALAGWMTGYGLDDEFMREASTALQPGSAGLFLLIRKMTTDKVLAELHGTGGTVLRTSFDAEKESALRQALAANLAATPAPPMAGTQP